MTAEWLDEDLSWFLLFVEAGFVAVNQSDEEAALKLFRAAELLNVNHSPLPKVGHGYLHLHKLELKQAVRCFEEVLEKDPENHMCKAFYGICLALQPQHVEKGEKVLDETLKETKKHKKDEMVHQLTYTAIDFVERFVKKSPGPAGKR